MGRNSQRAQKGELCAAELVEVACLGVGRGPISSTVEDWELRHELYKLLKRKTEATSEARKIVDCVGDSNGYEAWRRLGAQYEPQAGTKRLEELGELTMLQNKGARTPAKQS